MDTDKKNTLFIVFDLKEGEDYSQFRKDVYDFFGIGENIQDSKKLPNTTICIELDQKIDNFEQMAYTLRDKLLKKYKMQKYLIVNSREYHHKSYTF